MPVEKPDTCETCHGSGAAPGTSPKVCPDCQGRGVIAHNQGPFALSQPCPRCRGQGTIIEQPCPTCGGTGVQEQDAALQRQDPGRREGRQQIRIKGKGEAGLRGGPAGDLYVVVRVEPDDLFERRGDDLMLEVPVTVAEAALGAGVRDPHTGRRPVSLKVPARQPGRTHAARARQGRAAASRAATATCTCACVCIVPEKLTKEQKQLFEKLGDRAARPARGELG